MIVPFLSSSSATDRERERECELRSVKDLNRFPGPTLYTPTPTPTPTRTPSASASGPTPFASRRVLAYDLHGTQAWRVCFSHTLQMEQVSILAGRANI